MPQLKRSVLHIVTTIFNTAPGVKSLGPDHFSNTDILCLNETEVSPHALHIRCMDSTVELVDFLFLCY